MTRRNLDSFVEPVRSTLLNTVANSQYRNAVASGFLGHIARDPTLPRFGTDCFATALRISELNQLEFCPEASVGAVEEGAELAAVDVVLNIARIPVVCDVED